MKKYVIYNEDKGIYLGSMWGLGFWTNWDAVGQDEAIAFKSPDEALELVSAWQNGAEDIEIKGVASNHDGLYVTMDECVASGLPAWQV